MPRLLLYCTKSKNKYDRLVSDEHYGKPFYLYGAITENFESLNGKIVAECDFEVETFSYMRAECLTRTYLDLLKNSCLIDKEMYDYLQGKNGYAIHIKNLHIFDEPKELSDYCRYLKVYNNYGRIEVAPQNMMYAYEVVPFKEEHLIKGVLQEFRGNRVNEYILISIRPEWLCKILNGEKTIEVRKKVLKEMLK